MRCLLPLLVSMLAVGSVALGEDGRSCEPPQVLFGGRDGSMVTDLRLADGATSSIHVAKAQTVTIRGDAGTTIVRIGEPGCRRDLILRGARGIRVTSDPLIQDAIRLAIGGDDDDSSDDCCDICASYPDHESEDESLICAPGCDGCVCEDCICTPCPGGAGAVGFSGSGNRMELQRRLNR